MKKVLSVVFMFTFTLQILTINILTLGKDDVLWNKNGSKTIFVSTENLGVLTK